MTIIKANLKMEDGQSEEKYIILTELDEHHLIKYYHLDKTDDELIELIETELGYDVDEIIGFYQADYVI